MEKQKVYTAILSDYFILKNADWFLSKHCRLTIFSWASVPIPDFLDPHETFATSTTCVTKLTLAAKAAFTCTVLCFDVFKILFAQLVDRMLKNKSLHEHKARRLPPPLPPPALLVKNGH